jgi:hypothetical protein
MHYKSENNKTALKYSHFSTILLNLCEKRVLIIAITGTIIYKKKLDFFPKNGLFDQIKKTTEYSNKKSAC